MQPAQLLAREEAAWQDFVRSLGAHLADVWPAVQERLADRYDAFVEHAVQQALARGLRHAAGVARFVNLCMVWGASFQDRPGFEWARGLLAAPADREWLTVHQLVRRSLAELDGRPESRIKPADLAAADAGLVDRFGAQGRHGAMLADPEAPLPRRACDLDAAELRLLGADALQVYRLVAGEWQRLPLSPPAPLRIALTHPAPARVSLLTPPPGQGGQVELQVRLRPHAVCDAEHHPSIGFAGSHGLWSWRGHETKAVSWPVGTLDQPVAATGPGTAVAEETTPEVHRLDLAVCGLRDEGDALGAVALQVWAWPSTQWWIEIHRPAAPARTWLPPPGDMPAGHARCRVEADGRALAANALERGFVQGLDTACAQALRQLGEDWSALTGLTQPAVEGMLGLLIGRAALTWGWQLAAQGLAGRALMRVLGQIEMSACRADLLLTGELELGGGRARAQLKLAGDVPLKQAVQRETDAQPLLATVLPLVARITIPVDVELEPVASDSGCLLQPAGRPSGELTGEAGLRPRTAGGSGWEWFAQLRLEAVTLPVQVTDPFQGHRAQTLQLLPARTLIDWQLG